MLPLNGTKMALFAAHRLFPRSKQQWWIVVTYISSVLSSTRTLELDDEETDQRAQTHIAFFQRRHHRRLVSLFACKWITGRKKKKKLTDYGEIDAAVAGRWTTEIHSATVQSGIAFTHVINAQSGRLLDRIEKGSFTENLVVGPMAWSLGVLVPSVVSVNKQKNKTRLMAVSNWIVFS